MRGAVHGNVILETAGMAITHSPHGYLFHVSSLGAPWRQYLEEGPLRPLLQLGQRHHCHFCAPPLASVLIWFELERPVLGEFQKAAVRWFG